ncbi:hypothetical protein CBL_09850 [Carabus blaptoides fortunei]
MFKSLIFLSAILAVVLAETKFEKVPFGSESRSYSVGNEITQPKPVKSLGTYAVPPDNGGNYGDNLWRDRVQGDTLLTREVQINAIANVEQQFNWSANFPGRYISHIRFLNIGRERAWVEQISSNGGPTANAVIRVAGGKQFRLLVEVYGR